MRKWRAVVLVLGLAGLTSLIVFNRSTRQDSNRQAAPTTNPVVNTNSPATRGAPSTASASSNASISSQRADTAVSVPALSPNTAVPPSTQPPVTLPEPTVPEDELPQLSAPTVLENVRVAFRQFRLKFNSNPVGTNDELTRALNGDNPGQVRFLRMEDGMRINGKGELIDTWGTPYFFHQLSATEMEIHCAGPDKKMWTSDDLVIK